MTTEVGSNSTLCNPIIGCFVGSNDYLCLNFAARYQPSTYTLLWVRFWADSWPFLPLAITFSIRKEVDDFNKIQPQIHRRGCSNL